jgi:uncharacterized protein (TIGR00369 family)
MDYLSAVAAGHVAPPPVMSAIGIRLLTVEYGRVVVSYRPDETHLNLAGSINGGVLGTVLDTACAGAFHSTLRAGRGYASAEIKVSFLRTVFPCREELTAVGSVVKVGSRLGFAEARLLQPNGQIVATATSTLVVRDVDAARPVRGER